MGILVVEDDPFIAELVRQVLGSLTDAEVIVLSAAGPALNYLRGAAPQLVISDLNLPDGSGLEVIRAAARAAPRSRRILITSTIDRQTVLEARQAGITDFIAKPFTLEVLVKRLDGLLPTAASAGSSLSSTPANVEDYLQQRLTQILTLPWAEPANRDRVLVLAGPAAAQQVIQLARDEPLLTTALLSAANRVEGKGKGFDCASLEQAVERLGPARTLSLAQRQAKTRQVLKNPHLQTLAEALLVEQSNLAGVLTRLSSHHAIPLEPMLAAVSLSRGGELAVLCALQNFLDYGQPLDQQEAADLMHRHAASFGKKLQTGLHLPFLLRELTGALFRLPEGSMRTDQVIMRIAALETGMANDPAQLQKLRAWVGIRS